MTGKQYGYAYTVLMTLLLYWLSNLILWVPWSISPLWGMTLMLTLNPLIWGVGEYACLMRFPGQHEWKNTLAVSLIMVGLSVISDYLFFDVALHSNDVWHPTTFYGYAFVGTLPFVIRLMFRRRLRAHPKGAEKKELRRLILVNVLIVSIFFAFVI